VAQLGGVFVGTVAVNLDLRQVCLDPLELLVGQVDVSSAEVLLDPLELARSRDGHNEVLLVQHPREGDLRRSGALFLLRECSE